MDKSGENIMRESFELISHRIEALDSIEEKLWQLRELAVYAASRRLSEKEVCEIQEWVDILSEEIRTRDQATALGTPLLKNLIYK